MADDDNDDNGDNDGKVHHKDNHKDNYEDNHKYLFIFIESARGWLSLVSAMSVVFVIKKNLPSFR